MYPPIRLLASVRWKNTLPTIGFPKYSLKLFFIFWLQSFSEAIYKKNFNWAVILVNSGCMADFVVNVRENEIIFKIHFETSVQ